MYEKLVVGRYLDLPKMDKSLGMDVVGGPAHFVSTPGRDYQIQLSSGSGFLDLTRTSAIVAGQNPDVKKAHRNFRWLHWQPGKITYLPLAGADILSGPFSGCWIVIFSMAGVNYVGHIGTFDSPNTPIAAFQPHRHLIVGPTPFDSFWSVVTANQTLHAMRLHRNRHDDTLNQITTMTGVMGIGVSPGDPGHPNFV